MPPSFGPSPMRCTVLALDLKGTVSTQHGTGLARTPWVSRQYGKLYSVMREIKAIFDPHGLFNPGEDHRPRTGLAVLAAAQVGHRRMEGDNPRNKLALGAGGSNGAAPIEADPSSPSPATSGTFLDLEAWRDPCRRSRPAMAADSAAPALRASACVRCSGPRVTRPPLRAPKANLLRHLLEKDDEARLVSSDAVREVADLLRQLQDVAPVSVRRT